MPIREDQPHPSPAAPGCPGVAARLRGYPYLVGFLVVCVVLGVLVLRKRKATEFEWVYVLTARHLMTRRGIYELTFPPYRSFTYPPFSAVLGIPFALVPRTLGRVAWYLINVASLLVFWCGAWRLAGGGRLQGVGLRIDPREHLVAGLGLACALPYVLSVMDHQQTDILIAALLTAGGLALARSRSMAAATCFGLAAALKCTPLLWAPYLALRGRWRAAAWVVAVAVGVNLAADLIDTPPGGGSWLVAWCATFLRPMARPDFMPGTWHAWILDNQSVAGAANRWVTTRCAWGPDGLAIVAIPPLVSARLMRPLVLAAEAALVLAAWYALRRRPASPVAASTPAAPPREAIEQGTILLLMLLLSPMSSRTHFGLMLLPCLALARLAVYGKGQARGRVPGWMIASALVAGYTTAPLWGKSMARLSMWCGMVSWSAAFLLAGCAWVLCSGTPTSAAIPDPRNRAGRRTAEGMGAAADR